MLAKANYYEEVIDQMMIGEVSLLEDGIKEVLEKLPTHKKRIAILSILDKNRDLFTAIKKLIDNNDVTKTEYITQVVEMLREYVVVGDVEKKKYGEVMTPIHLVEDMMDTLPEEVWKDPNLKWLDPCSGVGIFSAVIVNRLMKGLEGIVDGEENRYRHIMEKMLYVGELQPKNMFLFLTAFDPEDIYDLNIYTGDYLSEEFDNHKKEQWDIDKFDITVGYPPYSVSKQNADKQGAIGKTIWPDFVRKYLAEELKRNGYMVVVTPPGWRAISGRYKKIQKYFKTKDVLKLNINSVKDGRKLFGVSTPFDYYCIQNNNTEVLTEIIDVNNIKTMINIKQVEFVPDGNMKRIYSLVAKKGEEKTTMIHDSLYNHLRPHVQKEKTDEYCYLVAQGIGAKGNFTSPRYTNNNKLGHYGIPKVLINPRFSGVIIDEKGEVGQTEFTYSIVDVPENLKNIQKALKNPDFVKNIMISAGMGCTFDVRLLAVLRKDFWKEFINY
jgi:hypothetical protein